MIDYFIKYFSPQIAYKRAKYRTALNVVKRHYEGASRSRRTARWNTPSTSARGETGPMALEVLRNRSRDLVRNNAYGKRAVSSIAINTVGKGIIPNITDVKPDTGKQVSELWDAWSASRFSDHEMVLPFYAQQLLVMRSIVESGEVLIRRRVTDKGPLSLSLQILEADHIIKNSEIPQKNLPAGNRVVQGIELDSLDRTVAYHLYKQHPGNMDSFSDLETVRVPADDIIHVFLKTRPGQLRGVPWMAPVIINLRDFDEFQDATLVAQKVAACFAAFIHDIEMPVESPLVQSDDDMFDLEKLEPGIVEHLPPGKDIKFGSPPLPPAGTYREFTKTSLQSVAVGAGVTYETLSGDLSEVNFSSGRMGWLEFSRAVDVWRSSMLIPMFCNRVFDWFLDSVTIDNNTDVTTLRKTWTPPRREMIDPTREVPAKIKAVRAGIETLSDVIRQNGANPNDHYAEIAENNKILDELGLILDTDPRRVTSSGQEQQNNEPD